MTRRCKHSLKERSVNGCFTAACCVSSGAGSMQQLLSLLVIFSSRVAIAVSSLQLRIFDTTVDCALIGVRCTSR